MEIREGKPGDIPEIISVLKASLGEADLPLSEEIWNYKHVNNPFGKSPVFVATESGRIAGVRAFMRWRWKRGDKTFSTFRAVDTATHPEFQGRGIFKKLTLTAVKFGEEDGSHFIFNTPNDQSRPGYIKMGWVPVDKLKVGIKPVFSSFFKSGDFTKDYFQNGDFKLSGIGDICKTWNDFNSIKNNFFTPKNLQYLEWRYLNNPLQNYEIFASNDLFMVAYVKKRKKLKELRLAECIFNTNVNISDKIKKITNGWVKKHNVHFVSYSPDIYSPGTGINGNFGPVLTVRRLNLIGTEMEELKDIQNWKYSLGDLELF